MRLTKLRGSLREHNIDAILVSQPENRRYLSGFTGSSGWLVLSAERAVLATDFRYFEQVGREAEAFELAKVTTKFSDLLPELLAELGVGRLGFESQHVTVDQLYEWSQAAEAVEWVPLKELESGMTLTVEPGVYLPGEFGVRLEDLVIIGEGGVEILTNTPKKPVID